MKNKNQKNGNFLQRFLNRNKNKEINAETNEISIFYDANLERITGVSFEKTIVPKGFTFADFLHSLFISYSEIPRKVPPGRLAFLINNAKPEMFDVLNDGDSVMLMAFEKGVELEKYQIGIIQRQMEQELSDLIKKYKINFTFEEIKEIIFNEKDIKDIRLNGGLNENEEREFFNVLMKARNYFPHKSLNGFCPIEKISELHKNSPYS